MEIAYAPSFIRKYKSLPEFLKEEVKEKIILFRDEKNYQQLRVHKLRGDLKDQYSFSVTHQIRIIFIYTKEIPRRAILLTIGDHDIYKV